MSEITKTDNQATIKPGQDVVASMANDFKAELQSLIHESVEELIIDLDGVEMVDSVGIGVMIATHNTLLKTGGVIKIVNVAEDIFNLFSTMRLDRHFAIEKK